LPVVQRLRVREQPLEPRELVVELGSGLRVAVRKVEAADDEPVHVASM
jgi:hypothetical protein